MCRSLLALVIIAALTSGCSPRDTVQNQLWRDQHPSWTVAIECSMSCLELLVNAALQAAALALSGK